MKSDVLYVEAWQNYTKVVLENRRVILCNESLKEREEKMTNGFIRVHNSYIINLDRVVRYHRTGKVELYEGILLPVARRRKQDFLSRLKSVLIPSKDEVFPIK